MTRRTVITILTIFLAVLCAGGVARAEDFKGENDLLRKIEPEERMTYFGLRYSLNNHEKRDYLTQPTREEREEWLER